MRFILASCVSLAFVLASTTAAARPTSDDNDSKPAKKQADDPNAPKPLGKPGEGPGPGAGVNGPKTGLTESDPSKPSASSNPWTKAGVSSKDASGKTSVSSTWVNDKRPSMAANSGSGFQAGGRLGFMLPSGSGFSDAYGSAIPIILDIGYRIIPQLYIGAYGQVAFAFVSSQSCPGNASCSAQDYRFGLNVQGHLPIAPTYDLWLGVGAGYEILHDSRSADPITLSTTFSGFELFNATVGFDFFMEPQIRVGPIVGLSVSKFSSASVSVEGSNSLKGGTQDLDSASLHQWLMAGVRVAYDF